MNVWLTIGRACRYVSEIVPMICEPGDDEQHGSSVVCDVNALQALSRRVHLGKFVAESKFQVRRSSLRQVGEGWSGVREPFAITVSQPYLAFVVGAHPNTVRSQPAIDIVQFALTPPGCNSTLTMCAPSLPPARHLFPFAYSGGVQEDSKTYQELCRAGDVLGVLDLLTNKAVEEKVLQRAFVKASTYGSDINDVPSCDDAKGAGDAKGERNFKVNPQCIVDIYREMVIPLTKDVEILYLFQRTGYPCPSLEGIHDT